MKRRMATIAVLITTLTTTFVSGDQWTPGNPKPPVPDPWYVELTGFFSDVWTYLLY